MIQRDYATVADALSSAHEGMVDDLRSHSKKHLSIYELTLIAHYAGLMAALRKVFEEEKEG